MDSWKAAEIIENRIRTLEPKITAKRILGYFWLLDITDSQIIHLALGPDTVIHDFIHNIKTAIFQTSPTSMPNFSFIESNPYLGSLDSAYSHFPYATPVIAPDAYQGIASQCDPVQVADQLKLHCGVANSIPYTDSMPGDDSLHEQFMGVEDPQKAVNSRSLSDYQYTDKTCHYFKRGLCRNGTNCRYLHTETLQESFPPKFVHNSYDGEDQFLSPGSLGKLETEITELLKSRGGHPISIASLPLMYYEKYGRTLQAEGYLSESQRHGKAGYSLTKFLARLKNKIRLIERPHGQHAVMLIEDYMKYTDIGEARNDIGSIVSGSRQLYMTFPVESIFTGDDVSNYFNNFGPVEDVRIPCQLKRMFGFITFLSSDTVKLILSEGNPHYICGARVLVKPYIEKSKLVERKYHEKLDGPMYYQSNPIDIDSELQAGWGSSKLLKRQLGQNQENAIEHEILRLQKLQLARERTTSQSCLGYSMDDLKWLKDHPKFSSEPFIEMFDALNVGSTTDDNCNPKCPVENSTDH